MFFSDRGRAYRLTAHDVPKGRLTAAPNLFQMGDAEQIVAVIDANVASEHEYVVFVTAEGGVKRTELSEFVEAGSRHDGIVAMKLVGDDRVVAVFPGWDDFETFVVDARRAGNPLRRSRRPRGRSRGRRDPGDSPPGRRPCDRRLRGRARGDGRDRDRRGLRQALAGRRARGAGARRRGSAGDAARPPAWHASSRSRRPRNAWCSCSATPRSPSRQPSSRSPRATRSAARCPAFPPARWSRASYPHPHPPTNPLPTARQGWPARVAARLFVAYRFRVADPDELFGQPMSPRGIG